MNYRKTDYKVQVAVIKNWIDGKPGCNVRKEISSLALATNCPILVITAIVIDEYGSTPELEACLSMLRTFYKAEVI